MSQISVNNLTFYYDGSYDNIFEDVSFVIDSDWKLGLVARNGRGKTTLLKLLMGKYEYKGHIHSGIPFEYFPFEIKEEEKEHNTIDVMERIYPNYELWKVCRELTLLQVDAEVLYRPFMTLSNGEQTKVMLALLFSKDNHFLLIDEPTNHLDVVTREIIKDYLSRKKGFILVSHDKWFLDACIDHVLAINKTNIEIEQGNFSTWQENKEKRDAFEYAENERLRKDIKRLEVAARKANEWADTAESRKIGVLPKNCSVEPGAGRRSYLGEKSRKMQQRRKNLENRQQKEIAEKSGLLKNIETAEDLKIFPLRYHKDVLVQAKDFGIRYGDKPVAEHLNFTIKNGDCVVLQGKNGCGKSSVLKCILGEDIATMGDLAVASGLKISYVSQDTSFLKGTMDDFIIENDLEPSIFKALLRKLDFDRVQFEKRLEEYSGGQKKKVLIAKSLCEQAHLYIWDEPLNYIDIFSRMQIGALIKQFQPTMLLVEHDRAFAEDIATEIVRF